MTRAEAQALLAAAVTAGRITAEQAATVLASFDSGALRLDSPAAVEAVIAGLARTKRRPGGGAWTYDAETRRYTAPATAPPIEPQPRAPKDPRLSDPPRVKPGKTLSPGDVRRVLDHALDSGEAEVVRLTEDLRAGRINLAEWQRRFERMIAVRVTASSALGMGGFDQMSPVDRGHIAREIAEQFKFFRGFVRDIVTGRQPLDGRAVARAKQYAQAPRGIYESIRGRAAQFGGNNEERRDLHGSDHCSRSARPGCIETALRGWVPIGTLPRIGATTCLNNCRCTFRFRRTA